MIKEVLLSNWWILFPILAIVFVSVTRFWAKRKFSSMVEDILCETQSGFAKGSVEVHSVTASRKIKVQYETAIVYRIDATITPSDESVEWCGSDLFLRGASGDPNQVGDVLTLKQWNGTSFQPIKNRAPLVGTQRLLLDMRFAGCPGNVRFNFNFANFGQEIQLPELEISI